MKLRRGSLASGSKRADAPERLTGQLRYTGDLALPGLLHARPVRSPHASARIVSVDRSAAERFPAWLQC
jgi:CO/xanthine dehydrogenase Mo-binding subunit